MGMIYYHKKSSQFCYFTSVWFHLVLSANSFRMNWLNLDLTTSLLDCFLNNFSLFWGNTACSFPTFFCSFTVEFVFNLYCPWLPFEVVYTCQWGSICWLKYFMGFFPPLFCCDDCCTRVEILRNVINELLWRWRSKRSMENLLNIPNEPKIVSINAWKSEKHIIFQEKNFGEKNSRLNKYEKRFWYNQNEYKSRDINTRQIECIKYKTEALIFLGHDGYWNSGCSKGI